MHLFRLIPFVFPEHVLVVFCVFGGCYPCDDQWLEVSELLNSQLRGPRGSEEDEDVEVRKTESDGWNNCRTHVTSGERGRTDLLKKIDGGAEEIWEERAKE